jgi:hypothetical protein
MVEVAKTNTLVRADALYTLHVLLILRTEKKQFAATVHAYMHAVAAIGETEAATNELIGTLKLLTS